MRNLELRRQLDALNALIAKSEDFGEDLELLGHWGRYLCVLAAGFLENALRELFANHVRQRADPQIARFAQKALERLTNPKADKFVTTAERFDPAWGRVLKDYLAEDDGRRKNAIDSLMANRNVIAHGRGAGISVSRVRAYLKDSVQVLGEPRRDCRRPHLLRGWGHEQGKEVLPGDAGAGRSVGAGAR
jgi:hypothetical protein